MTIKNASQLRDSLAENFAAIKAGTLEPHVAEAMTNIAGKMISSAVAQLKMAEINRTEVSIAFLKEATTDNAVQAQPEPEELG